MTDDTSKEAQVRRAAHHVGWRSEKSRVRNAHANDHGLFQLLNDNIVIGGDRFDANLEDCAHWIEEERVRQAA